MEHETRTAAAISPQHVAAFRSQLDRVRARVDARLTTRLEERRREAASFGADTEAMASAVASLTMRGGKRFRPALLSAGFLTCGGEDDLAPTVIEAGAALELLQTYLLVHDDWMDGDSVRRGGPSVHSELRRHFGQQHLGDASAILAGDFACGLAQECMASAVDGRADASQVFRLFAAIQQRVIFGQQLDLSGRSEDVETMHRLKTGEYTVRGPLLLGAALARGSADAQAALERYATPLGVAFQLRDDLLGAFGEPAETGKPFGSDVRAGKRTAVVAEALGRLDTKGRALLDGAFGRAEATDTQVLAACQALDACGARAAVEARLHALVSDALLALDSASLSAQGVSLLIGAAAALSVRRT